MYKMRYLSLLPMLIMMIVIFWFSSKPSNQSSEMSGTVVNEIIDLAEKIGGFSVEGEERIQWFEWIHTPIRKLGHLTEYTVFGMTVLFALVIIKGYKGFRLLLYGEGFCFLYAITDEFHQLFVPGRSAEIRDILIDAFGSLLGCFGFLAVYSIIQFIKKNQQKKHSKIDTTMF